jgi:hypothetical protein
MKKMLGVLFVVAMVCMFTASANAACGDDGLVAYYPFNGNANDASDCGNDGTVSGATLAADKDGNPDSAYSFDGADDHILADDDQTLNLSDALTLSAWINPENPDLDFNHFVEKSNQYSLSLFGSELLVSLVDVVPDIDDHWRTGIVLSETTGNRWYHIAATYDNALTQDQIIVYVDGVRRASLTVASGLVVAHTTNKFAIGCQGWRPDLSLFNGSIDEVRIYNRALSSTEICELAGLTNCGGSPCVGAAAASTLDASPVHESSDLAKHLTYFLLPLGAVIGLSIWRRKR